MGKKREILRRKWPTSGKRISEFRTFSRSPVSFWIAHICSSSRRREQSGLRRVCPRGGSKRMRGAALRKRRTIRTRGEGGHEEGRARSWAECERVSKKNRWRSWIGRFRTEV